jgi:hypothetical protein
MLVFIQAMIRKGGSHQHLEAHKRTQQVTDRHDTTDRIKKEEDLVHGDTQGKKSKPAQVHPREPDKKNNTCKQRPVEIYFE